MKTPNPTEFNLSDKICWIEGGDGKSYEDIEIEDVKEFIKQEEYLIIELTEGMISPDEFWDKRKKLTGDKLTK